MGSQFRNGLGCAFRTLGLKFRCYAARGGSPDMACVCVYIYMYACVYIYIYIHIYIYTWDRGRCFIIGYFYITELFQGDCIFWVAEHTRP